jgi:hypothetical protein
MMKRMLSLLLAALMLLTAFPALAASTEQEWNDSCNWVISKNATLYRRIEADDVTTTTDLYTYEAIGSIAKGKRISIRSSSGSMREISYWDGGVKTAWVEDSAVRWASNGATGESTNPGNSTPRKTYSGDWEDLKVTYLNDEGVSVRVELKELGTAQCEVLLDGDVVTVPTARLQWETEADEEHMLAVISAPRTGKATLRKEARSSSRALAQCEAGRIVIVLKLGDNYSRILYDGKEGLVLNGALEFKPVVPEDQIETGTLAYKGRTDTSATISVYSDTGLKRRLKQFRVGTEIVLFGETGSLTEVEIGGYHGYVKSAYLE